MNCHDDCPPPTCGNGVCEDKEWEKNCPSDCKPRVECGDGICDWYMGENPETCAIDCGSEPPKCGNRICEEGETKENCFEDCKPGECGDGFCGMGENPENCMEDCGMVVKPGISYCPPEESLAELKKKCEELNMDFSLRQGHDGCLFGECNTGYQINPERRCREVVEENGFVRRVCEEECFPEPLEIKQRCIEERGTPRESTDFRGCPITVCEFGETGRGGFIGKCPDKREMEEKLQRCEEQGLKPVIEFGFNGCEYVNCAGDFKRDECPYFDFEEIERIRGECSEKNGQLIKEFDARGCAKPRCIMEGEIGEYCKDVPEEAFERCEEEGGELIVKKDEQGCVVFETCNRRGERRFEYDDVDELPDITKLLAIALKLEDLKIQLGKVRNKIASIAGYYREEGDSDNAERFEKAVLMLSSIEEEIKGIKDRIRENADFMDRESVMEIKKGIKLIREKLKDILFVLLGEKERKKEGREGDCGTDEECFQKNYVVCNPVKYTHTETDGKKFRAEIIGLDKGKCVMKVTAEIEGRVLSMTCKDPSYIDSDMDAKKMGKICTGPLTEIMGKDRGDDSREPGRDFDRDFKDYGEYKDDFGRNVEGCKETFDEQGNKYITCPVKEEERARPYSPMTANVVMGIKWRE